jgi:hypothetical protein
MKVSYNEDTLDNSNWICVNIEASENEIDHDALTELELIRHKHNLSGGSDHSTSFKNGVTDHMRVYIENPTKEFKKDFTYWLFKT